MCGHVQGTELPQFNKIFLISWTPLMTECMSLTCCECRVKIVDSNSYQMFSWHLELGRRSIFSFDGIDLQDRFYQGSFGIGLPLNISRGSCMSNIP